MAKPKSAKPTNQPKGGSTPAGGATPGSPTTPRGDGEQADAGGKKNRKKAPKSPGVFMPGEVAQMFQLDLKRRGVAALLAWLWPGAGHLYQGRTAKGLLFMICIGSTLVFGMVAGRGKVAYATPLRMQDIAQASPGLGLPGRVWKQAFDRWPFIFQAGIGAVAVPAVIERERFFDKGQPMFGGCFFPPRKYDENRQRFTSEDSIGNVVRHPDELAKWNHDYGFDYELGTIYTVIAGLLNLLVVFDAYSGPLIQKPPATKEEEPAATGPGQGAGGTGSGGRGSGGTASGGTGSGGEDPDGKT
ncbi:MAG: DUF6677 family protein [Planctomycetota bacterium]